LQNDQVAEFSMAGKSASGFFLEKMLKIKNISSKTATRETAVRLTMHHLAIVPMCGKVALRKPILP
jgi:hypothetical protein